MFTLNSVAQVPTRSYQFSDEPLDFSPFQTVYKAEVEVQYPKRHGNLLKVWNTMQKDAMSGDMKPYKITRTGISMSTDNSTVRQSRNRVSYAVQKQYQKQQRDAERRTFFEQRQEERRRAAVDAHNRKIENQRQARILDESLAAEERQRKTMQLQGRTNQRMQNDQWHATQGKQIVRQVAREELGKPQGMNVIRTSPIKRSGSAIANNMRNNQSRNRNRMPVSGGMEYYSRRPMPPIVRQKPNTSGKYVFTGRATKSQIFIEKDKNIQIAQAINGPSLAKGGREFRLSPHATVTTGQDWHSTDFRQPTEKPIPVFKPRKQRVPRPIVTFSKEISYEEKLDELMPDEHAIL